MDEFVLTDAQYDAMLETLAKLIEATAKTAEGTDCAGRKDSKIKIDSHRSKRWESGAETKGRGETCCAAVLL